MTFVLTSHFSLFSPSHFCSSSHKICINKFLGEKIVTISFTIFIILTLFLMKTGSKRSSIHWFRKGLRLHDNPALVEACSNSDRVFPIFVLDPWFANSNLVGINRYAFLLQSLNDLDINLRKLGSRLYVVKGNPKEVIPHLCVKWDVSLITYEKDTEPYAIERDNFVNDYCLNNKIKISTYNTHTLHNVEDYLSKSRGEHPKSYQGFLNLFHKVGIPRKPIPSPETDQYPSFYVEDSKEYDVPSLTDMGYPELKTPLKFLGGESEALKRLDTMVISRPDWVATFEKPNTSPNALEPSTTVLSPYLKFGCLSPSLFYHTLADIYSQKKNFSSPPVSLHGQLLWREYFYFTAYVTPKFDKMVGNAQCKQIPWENDPEKLLAWKEGRTGYPFIDAVMTQLREEGWIHHLARHAVACFLTRGDLWQHWEEGVKVFDLYLLDADWSLNNANWQWLSCSNFFYQYFRCYSPIAFGKKTDPTGAYIRKWIPVLKKIPDKYIFEPWKAPKEIQKSSGCIIGVDYPNPIVEHDKVSKINMDRMKNAYDLNANSSDLNKAKEPNSSLSAKRKIDSYLVPKSKK